MFVNNQINIKILKKCTPILLCIATYNDTLNIWYSLVLPLWCFRTLWKDAPFSLEACFSIWRRIASGGAALCLCQTVMPFASMRAKLWVHFLLDETAVRFGGTLMVKQMESVCYLSNRHMNGASTQKWPSTVQDTRPWPQWRNTWSWLMPAFQVGKGQRGRVRANMTLNAENGV